MLTSTYPLIGPSQRRDQGCRDVTMPDSIERARERFRFLRIRAIDYRPFRQAIAGEMQHPSVCCADLHGDQVAADHGASLPGKHLDEGLFF